MATSRLTIALTGAVALGLAASWPSTASAAVEQPGEASALEVRSIGARQVLFYRTLGDSSGVEGFVVDTDVLVDTLKERVLRARGLEEVAQMTRLNESPSAPAPEGSRETGFFFDRHFAEPFSSINARLHVGPLADPSDGAPSNSLIVLLGLSIVVGLYGLYRMAKTHMVFAERSRNFVAAVSHELKTPLTAIRLYSEMLAEGVVADEPKQLEYYRTITAESERLTRLIENVLTLSRLERKRPLPLRLGNVVPLVNDVCAMLEPHARKQGFDLKLELTDKTCDVWFEDDALKQILYNLIDNAIKYGSDCSEKRVTVRVMPEPYGVRLTVRDTGPGVRATELSRIFLPFYRSESELTRKHPGTGIGLALVKGLAERLGAQLSAHNANPGFVVSLSLRAQRE